MLSNAIKAIGKWGVLGSLSLPMKVEKADTTVIPIYDVYNRVGLTDRMLR